MRAARNPLHPYSALEVLKNDLIGRNSGNLIFAGASHYLLSAEGTSVDTDAMLARSDWANRANAEYDGVVLPLANCFRNSFKNQLESLTEGIRKLRIPFAMLSGGVQAARDDTNFDSLEPIKDTVIKFASAVLDHSTALSVRGDFTAEYLNSLGFSDVEVVGCPSMTRVGYQHQIVVPRLSPSVAKIGYGAQPGKNTLGSFIRRMEDGGHQAIFVAQDIRTLEMLLWHREKYPRSSELDLPTRLEHRHIASGNVVFFLDASTWINWASSQDIYIGPRIHGALAAVSAGTPALLVAHDARTAELAEYHQIPYTSPIEIQNTRNLETVWEKLKYERFNEGHQARVRKVVEYLNRNGFKTTLDEDQANARALYKRQVDRLSLPDAVTGADTSEKVLIGELRRQVVALEKRVKNLEKR